MPGIPLYELDRMILTAIRLRWRKMALVILAVMDECEVKKFEIKPDAIHDRIVDLIEAGMVKSQGDMSQWSEVRLALEDVE